LADFGFAMQIDDMITYSIGTNYYVAPELRTATPDAPCKGQPADLFSFGATLFAAKTLKMYNDDIDYLSLIKDDDSLKLLLAGLLNINPVARLEAFRAEFCY